MALRCCRSRCCRSRCVLICVCTPCLSVALMFVYVSVRLNMIMKDGSLLRTTPAPAPAPKHIHFVATGTSRDGNFAAVPHHFWRNPSSAIWNQLQLAVDYHFNPVLNPIRAKDASERTSFGDSLLNQSFSEVTMTGRDRNIFEQLPEHLQEYVTYMKSRSYPTLIQPHGLCGAQAEDETEPPLILFAIKTTASNYENRQAIRKSWGQVGWVGGQKSNSSGGEAYGGYVRRVFLLGQETTEDLRGDVSDLLRVESQHHGDILHWDFKDTFFNLTLKDVLFWRWFSRHCDSHFVFKGDDDVFVNTPKLVGYLHDLLQEPDAHNTMRDFMIGHVIEAAVPSRVRTSKYFIPDHFYKGLYPLYLGGGGVVYSGLLAKRLHDVSKTVHLFPIDDVYVGMCMFRLDAFPVHHPAFLTFDFSQEEAAEPCSYHTIFLVHKRSPKQMADLWADLKNTSTQCGHVSLRTDPKTLEGEKRKNFKV
ncbi:N-acetyllactosaminide beta-1,3-N-acetylglucosaminyltransferase 2-like [Cololabis saira]|uniref:N-acetyllactosaminide beta-1,3-N-acetylglucosaminyltransferase 2-like n=1 Tax=Cololabis saira TaxID=129043 RepID=UPI002AD3EF6B|nr:N-acetyllactosaminide beta-1,3-N-acetylglucosaminyltransferase 2-like [Cololabis saira]